MWRELYAVGGKIVLDSYYSAVENFNLSQIFWKRLTQIEIFGLIVFPAKQCGSSTLFLRLTLDSSCHFS